MDHELDPVVGSWYTDVDDGRTFVILAVDEDRGIIEIQHADGEAEEIDLREWEALDLEPAEAPEDWAVPPEEGEAEDDAAFKETDSWRAPAGGARRRQSAKDDWEEEEDEDDDEDEDWDEESDDDYYDVDR